MKEIDRALMDGFADTVLMAIADSTILPPDQLADYCYEMASAMLDARQRKIQQKDLLEALDHDAVWGGPDSGPDVFGGPVNDRFKPNAGGKLTDGAQCCGTDCGACEEEDVDIFGALEAIGANVITLSGPEEIAEFLDEVEQCETDADMQALLDATIKRQQH